VTVLGRTFIATVLVHLMHITLMRSHSLSTASITFLGGLLASGAACVSHEAPPKQGDVRARSSTLASPTATSNASVPAEAGVATTPAPSDSTEVRHTALALEHQRNLLLQFYPEPGEARSAAEATCLAKTSGAEANSPAALESTAKCILRRHFSDPRAEALALGLFHDRRIAVSAEHSHTMDGGYRGMIEVKGTLPEAAARKHLEWSSAAFAKHQAFRKAFAASAKVDEAELPYFVTPKSLRFFTSSPRPTPSAYAIDEKIAYNLIGTLMQTEASVEETLLHEVFHLNDQAHKNWSLRALGGIHSRIHEKCGDRTPCLTRYSPGTTMVRGGTYYAFHKGNDAREYAAELMVRFYREVSKALAGKPVANAFKCQASENAEAWQAFLNEFWNGHDPLPACR
jgi:hypothetical protein